MTDVKEYKLSDKKTCPYCQSQIKKESEIIFCSNCGTPHHSECWNENGGCTTYGCINNPATVKKNEQEINIGDRTIEEIENLIKKDDSRQESNLKQCPNCKNPIDKNSVYCKYCGEEINKETKSEASAIDREFRNNYKEGLKLKKRTNYLTYLSTGILTALLLFIFIISYKIIDNRINADEDRIKNLCFNWNMAFKTKEPDNLKAFYEKDFIYYDKSGNELNFDKRFKQLSAFIKNEKYKNSLISDINFRPDSNSTEYAFVTFKQNFYSDKETKSENRYFKLYKNNESGKWKIFREYSEF